MERIFLVDSSDTAEEAGGDNSVEVGGACRTGAGDNK